MDYRKLCQLIVKYVISGMTVAFAAFFIPRRNMDLEEISMIAFTAAATFAVLEHYAPNIYKSSLFGSGFGIGGNQVGFEGFVEQKVPTYNQNLFVRGQGCLKYDKGAEYPKALDCNLNEFF